jgi:hypothetical protein
VLVPLNPRSCRNKKEFYKLEQGAVRRFLTILVSFTSENLNVKPVLRLCRLCNQLETILDQLKSATFLQTISLHQMVRRRRRRMLKRIDTILGTKYCWTSWV